VLSFLSSDSFKNACVDLIFMKVAEKFADESQEVDYSVSGRVFYIKRCKGKGKEEFDVYKFRTMKRDAGLLDSKIRSKSEYDQYGAPTVDPRILRFGKLLRSSKFDELPQIVNVAEGNMRLVGVRPMRQVDWERYPEEIMSRALEDKPGLWGFQYAIDSDGDFDTHLNEMSKFLELRKYQPFWTDVEYFLGGIVNYFVKRPFRTVGEKLGFIKREK
jgi:lipopolysaccharide/colanic/teichoic acid biosynthesis glycosyltransferase